MNDFGQEERNIQEEFGNWVAVCFFFFFFSIYHYYFTITITITITGLFLLFPFFLD